MKSSAAQRHHQTDVLTASTFAGHGTSPQGTITGNADTYWQRGVGEVYTSSDSFNGNTTEITEILTSLLCPSWWLRPPKSAASK